MNILVIEDNPDIAANIGDYLEVHGHEVDFAADGHLGLNLLKENSYDVVILDVMLPRADGLQVCRCIRNELELATPVLMLTAKDQLEDKVAGFEAGADDYLVKPFSLKEPELRVQALSRRRPAGAELQGRQLRVGDLYFDLNTLNAKRDDQLLSLNPVQRRLLEVLMRNTDRVVRREELEEALRRDGRDGVDTLRVHIHGLRSVIDKPFEQALLKTVHGVGYRLTDD